MVEVHTFLSHRFLQMNYKSFHFLLIANPRALATESTMRQKSFTIIDWKSYYRSHADLVHVNIVFLESNIAFKILK